MGSPRFVLLAGVAALLAALPALAAEPSRTAARPAAAAARAPVAPNYDAKPQILAYAATVQETYAAAAADAERLRAAIDLLLKDTTEQSLADARNVWVNARPNWLLAEAFRFPDSPVEAQIRGARPLVSRINAWPIDEAFLDYIEANPTAGLINDTKQPITKEELLKRHQAQNPRHVAYGWHAIEFLLWGQDQDVNGPGQRAFTDFLPGQVNNDRRRLVLKLQAEQLVEDLKALASAWDPKQTKNYAQTFRMLNQRDALGRILTGLAQATRRELADRGLAIPLDSGSQSEEQSNSSDTTDRDLAFTLRGVRYVWFGDASANPRPGLDQLVQRLDAGLATRVVHALNRADATVAAIEVPFDRGLQAAANAPSRQKAEAAVTALRSLAAVLKEVGTRLNVPIDTAG